MRAPPVLLRTRLSNTAEIELWPAALLRARGNDDARALARAETVLRRKRDGRYLAAVRRDGLQALVPRLAREPGLDAALDLIDGHTPPHGRMPPPLPLHRLHERLHALGLDADAYAARSGLALVAEPAWLLLADIDRFGRPLWLLPSAGRAWQAMRRAAAADGLVLDAISGYRSHDYQLGIVARKLARGQTLEQILTVNAAPGYSEHHAGDALDIGTPGEPPAEESFERTPAFAWLQAQAARFGFALSYPRDNPHGIVYEPWHWRWHPASPHAS